MANISDIPKHLREHAKRMPGGLLGRLHPAEAEHRLTHVHDTLRAAESLQAEQYRHVTRQADRELKAMPYDEFCAERDRVRHLRDGAANLELSQAWADALRNLEQEHPQVPGVGEAIMAYEKANMAKTRKPSRVAVQKALDAEIARVTAHFRAEEAKIRKEIRDLQEQMSHGGQR